MKHLEDENKKLETKLKILKEHEEYGGKIDDIVKQLENEMEEQIENLIRDQEKLQAELTRKQQEVEDTRKRFVFFSAAVLYLLWSLLDTLNLHKLAQGRKTFFLSDDIFIFVPAMRMSCKRKLSWKMTLF